MDLYRADDLNEHSLNDLFERFWKVAVITHAEDKQLIIAGFRSKLVDDCPLKRWAAAGIVFAPSEASLNSGL